ncbi:MAG: hypothetical protein JST21_02335 [Bacteroidetes bacterium]|nr:hypothetical protein [Bacteroidota bacterium]
MDKIETHGLQKLEWTESNFDQMGWHDSKIYAVAFGIKEYELCFDIDYILEWINPQETEDHFKFMVVPATLVFRNVHDLKINFSLVEVTIEDIYRDNPVQPKNYVHIKEENEYDWIIETNNGEVSFKSVGFNQYARQKPRLLDNQSIDFVERGGISFNI